MVPDLLPCAMQIAEITCVWPMRMSSRDIILCFFFFSTFFSTAHYLPSHMAFPHAQLKWVAPEEPGSTGPISYNIYCSPAPTELEPGVEVDPEVRTWTDR